MDSFFVRLRPFTLCAALVAAAGLSASCGILNPREDVVTLEITTEDDSQVLLVTSDNFTIGQTAEGQLLFNLIDSDTTWIDTPYSDQFQVEPSEAGIGGFFGQALQSENPDATVTMRALIDGEESFHEQSVLTGEGLRFYYRRY